MITEGDAPRDLSRLAVPLRGSLEATGDLFEPYRLVDAFGVVVVPAAAYFRELTACGRPSATHRSYGMAMLRCWRFLQAVGVRRDQATRADARDFCSWIQLADKPVRMHWRYPDGDAPGALTARAAAGTPNPVTGKPSPGRGYATATVVHCESVLRGFYEFHLQAGSGPMVNPFPLARGRRGRLPRRRRPQRHHLGHPSRQPGNPMAGRDHRSRRPSPALQRRRGTNAPPGSKPCRRTDPEREAQRLIARLEALGKHVTLDDAA